MSGQPDGAIIVRRPHRDSLIMALPFCAVAAISVVVAVLSAIEDEGVAVPVLMAVIAVALCFVVVVKAFAARALLYPDRLEVHTGFRFGCAPRAGLLGYRAVPNARSSNHRLVLAGGGHVDVEPYVYNAPQLQSVFAHLPDLDEQDLARSTEALENDPALGATPWERRGAVARMRSVATVGNIAGFACGASLVFWRPLPGSVAVAALLLAPLALGLHIWSRGVLALDARSTDARPSLSTMLMTPLIGLAISSFYLHIVDERSLAVLALGGGCLILAAAATLDEELRGTWSLFGVATFASFFYAYGFVVYANMLLDRAPPKTYTVRVQDKHVTHGKSTTYYVDLAPWGPLAASDIRVDAGFYEAVDAGSHICIALKPGWLGIRWFDPQLC